MTLDSIRNSCDVFLLQGGDTFPLRYSGDGACGISVGKTIVLTGGHVRGFSGRDIVTRWEDSFYSCENYNNYQDYSRNEDD